MKEETNSIYGKPRFGLIVGLFAVALLALLLAGWFFLRTGHPDMHTQPQPRNNKGALQHGNGAAPQLQAVFRVPLAGIISRS